jgi:L-rhamnose mutarotase
MEEAKHSAYFATFKEVCAVNTARIWKRLYWEFYAVRSLYFYRAPVPDRRGPLLEISLWVYSFTGKRWAKRRDKSLRLHHSRLTEFFQGLKELRKIIDNPSAHIGEDREFFNMGTYEDYTQVIFRIAENKRDGTWWAFIGTTRTAAYGKHELRAARGLFMLPVLIFNPKDEALAVQMRARVVLADLYRGVMVTRRVRRLFLKQPENVWRARDGKIAKAEMDALNERVNRNREKFSYSVSSY